MAKIKKRLTISEEFEIMKLVLDKFLWLGFIVMTFGMYTMFTKTFAEGLVWLIVGAVILILFMIIIVREYEIIK
ncbi:MAG TPA: hypothetical protein VJI46_04695 [Candidatus Nanoarchaeia archaeon]|nr:hypothetical protein [Candidatus Nanoarchaeia archaeon]